MMTKPTITPLDWVLMGVVLLIVVTVLVSTAGTAVYLYQHPEINVTIVG